MDSTPANTARQAPLELDIPLPAPISALSSTSSSSLVLPGTTDSTTTPTGLTTKSALLPITTSNPSNVEDYIHKCATICAKASSNDAFTLFLNREKLGISSSEPVSHEYLYNSNVMRLRMKIEHGAVIAEAGDWAAVACWEPPDWSLQEDTHQATKTPITNPLRNGRVLQADMDKQQSNGTTNGMDASSQIVSNGHHSLPSQTNGVHDTNTTTTSTNNNNHNNNGQIEEQVEYDFDHDQEGLLSPTSPFLTTPQHDGSDGDRERILQSLAQNKPLFASFLASNLNIRLRVLGPRRPHWHLSLMARTPGRKDKGAVRALLQTYVERARREKVPVWLEAGNERARDVYGWFGFKVVGVIRTGKGRFDDLGREVDLLLRNGEGGGGGGEEVKAPGIPTWCMVANWPLE